MKKSPLVTVLLVILTVSALASVVLCYQYTQASKELRQLNVQQAMINNNRNLIGALATDVVEYSKRNPAIDPILEAAGIKQKAGLAAPKSGAK